MARLAGLSRGARLLNVLTREPAFQQRVMNAIYGPRGVKAGYTDGACRDDLLAADAACGQSTASQIAGIESTAAHVTLARLP